MIVSDSRLIGHIGERSIPIVAVESVRAEVTYVQVGPTVIIVVGYRCSHSPAFTLQPRFASHIGESSVSIVSVQSIRDAALPG